MIVARSEVTATGGPAELEYPSAVWDEANKRTGLNMLGPLKGTFCGFAKILWEFPRKKRFRRHNTQKGQCNGPNIVQWFGQDLYQYLTSASSFSARCSLWVLK